MTAHPIVEKVNNTYGNVFGGKHIVVRSPGRVNIIGEHTDYNEGFVLPAAIDKAAYVAAGKREDKIIKLYAAAFNESYEIDVEHLLPTDKGWPNYIIGVVAEMLKRGKNVQGFNLVLDSDVPIGAGMSSSAAIECAAGFAINELFNLGLSRTEIALIGQQAEHQYAGVKSGIMDQFASVHGKKDHVIRLDCRSLEFEYMPFRLINTSIVLLNTNVSHSLAGSEYNQRRAQCEEGVALISRHHPEVKSLRDASMEMLIKYVKPAQEEIFRRCKYVVEENERLLAACKDLEQNNIAALGKKMFATHEGLSKEYNVSCKELDFLVDYVKEREGVLGARMMGGGFGGCTINLVKNEAINDLVKDAGEAYKNNMGKEMTYYIATAEEGTSVILH